MDNQRNYMDDLGRDTGSNYGGSGSTSVGGGNTGVGLRPPSEASGTGAADAMTRTASGLRDQFSGVMDYFRENGVQDMVDDMTAYVKSHPAQALIGAAVLGFFAGRMARRS